MSSKTIDDFVKELIKLPDEELVQKAFDYTAANLSGTLTSTIKNTCNEYKPGDSIPMDKKTYIAMFVAFEELIREKLGGKTSAG